MRATLVGEVLKMDMDDLNRLVEVVKSRRAQLAQNAIYNFGVGDAVQFQSGKKRGRYARQMVKGTIHSLGRKNIKVDTGSVMWTVPATMLTLQEK